VFAEHPVAGFVQRGLEIAPGVEDLDVVLVLGPGVSCSGTARAPETLLGSDSAGGRWLHLSLRHVDVQHQPVRRVSVRADDDGSAQLRLAGLQPGRYALSLGVSGRARSAPLELEIRQNGPRGFELEFAHARE
jgi:hypothetical protein